MKILWFFVCCLCIALNYVDCGLYDGFKIYELATTNQTIGDGLDLSELSRNESFFEQYSISGSPDRMMVHPKAQADFLQLLQIHNMSYTIVNHNVGLKLLTEFITNSLLRRMYPYQGRLGTKRYY